MYSGIKSSRNGYQAVTYPMTDKKDQTGERIGAFRCGGGILDTGNVKSIRRQFAKVWKRGGRKIGDIQAYMLLFSFSTKELNPDDPDSPDRAADLAAAAVEHLYPGHHYTLVAQKDGKGGKLHVHATINALHSVTLRACRGRQTSYLALRDEIEAEMQKAGIDLDYGKDHTKARNKRQKKREAVPAADYCWTEDLAKRIHTALGVTERFSDLEANLIKQGVEVAKKTKSNWTFVLKNADDEKYTGKKARGERLDEQFLPSKMRQFVDENFQRRQRQQRVGQMEENIKEHINDTPEPKTME